MGYLLSKTKEKHMSENSNPFIEHKPQNPKIDSLKLSLRAKNQLEEIVNQETVKAMEHCDQTLISDLRKQVTESELFSVSIPTMEEMAAWIVSPDSACQLDDQSQMKLRAFVTLRTAFDSFKDIYNERSKKKSRKQKIESKPQPGNAVVAVKPTVAPEPSLTVSDISELMSPVAVGLECVVHEAPNNVSHGIAS